MMNMNAQINRIVSNLKSFIFIKSEYYCKYVFFFACYAPRNSHERREIKAT